MSKERETTNELGHRAPANDDTDVKRGNCRSSRGLKKAILRRRASLTVGERAFLHALLINDTDGKSDRGKAPSHEDVMDRAKEVLDDDILFSLPFKNDSPADNDPDEHGIRPPRPGRHDNSRYIGLWKAHEDGVAPSTLKNLQFSTAGDDERLKRMRSGLLSAKGRRSMAASESSADRAVGSLADRLADGIESDEEVRRGREDDDDASGASSWDLSEGGFNHYDAWAVLEDEYADDFGFGFERAKSGGGEEEEDSEVFDSRHLFAIVGTSAGDIAAHPHVLSPPLMDSLLNFVPDGLSTQNFWLKFSLMRDGANMDILKRYVRAAQHTILAIETTDGAVFGAFTSSAWRTRYGYFGSGEAFLWKMRHGRMTPCHSLFEQAQLESEIDVFFYSNLNDYVQLCTNDKIAIGGGDLGISDDEEHGNGPSPDVFLEEGENYGFGLAVSDDLLHGTSSPCATFRNTCLVNHSSKGEIFEVANLEIWTFTPCQEESDAERLEMTKFFVEESAVSSLSSVSSKSRSRDLTSQGTGTSVSSVPGGVLSRVRFPAGRVLQTIWGK